MSVPYTLHGYLGTVSLLCLNDHWAHLFGRQAAIPLLLTSLTYLYPPPRVPAQLLGFPIQLIGLLALPYLGIKYYVEGEDPKRDAEGVLKKVTSQLPGLGKK